MRYIPEYIDGYRLANEVASCIQFVYVALSFIS